MSNPLKLIVPAVFGVLVLFGILIFGAAFDTINKEEQTHVVS